MHENEEKTSAPAKPEKPRAMWKLWLGLALLVAFIVGAQFEKYSKEGQARSAAAWRGAVQQIGQDACDAYEWSQSPGKCEALAKEAREDAQRRLQNYQR